MDLSEPTPQQLALDRAVDAAGGKTSLMRKLNERGWKITSHNTISQWRLQGSVPADYCPDIEVLTGVRCEELRPAANWDAIRGTRRAVRRATKTA